MGSLEDTLPPLSPIRVAQPLQVLVESGVRAQVDEEGHPGNGDRVS